MGLAITNWLLLLDGIGVFIIGTSVWFFSLTQRDNFHEIVAQQSSETIIAIQDKLKCCGYFNSTDLAVVGGTFCANQTFVEVTNNATQNFCVGPITAYSDYTLNNIFTSVYGYMAVIISLILLSLCVIKKVRPRVTSSLASSFINDSLFPHSHSTFYRGRKESVSERSTRSVVAVALSKA